MRTGFRVFALLLCVFSAFMLAGCQHPRRAYILTGQVIGKEPGQQLIIANDDIPGFMPPMTMPYTVKDPGGFERAQPRDIIRADIMKGGDGQYWLEHVVVTGKAAAATASKSEGSVQPLAIGDKPPDVPLVNQDSKTLHFSQFKGKAVLFTFIYTRCPFPDYCPQLNTQFATMHERLAKNPDEYKKTHLISISLDPDYDKPPVLRKYGLSYLDDDPKGFEHWDFVRTTPADLRKLVDSFGLEYSEKAGKITHSVNTILLTPDGAIANMWPTNDWQTSEVLDVLRHAAAPHE